LIEKRFDPNSSHRRVPQPLRIAALAVLAAGVLMMGYAVVKSLRSSTSDGQRVVVGSKDFTESVLLAEMVAQMLEAQDLTVDRRFDLGGNLPHTALTNGQIDIYPEYTGTAFTVILRHQPISDPRAVYEQVKREYESLNLVISPTLGFENTYAILIRGEDARRLNLRTISEAAAHTSRWRVGFGQDFMSRAYGYPGLVRAYRLQFAEPPHEMALDLSYKALASHQVDLIAGNSTDGRIPSLDLFQLADDRLYFPPYEAVFMARSDTLSRVPALAEIMQKLSGSITTAEMRQLNYEVDGAHRDKKVVVREWLLKKGFVH
jgi:glycine betaine/choline ABC-type transport system substrate-binding protein